MKITQAQQPTVAPRVEKVNKTQGTAATKSVSKPQQKDRVEFSKNLDAELRTRQAEQAQRVAEIKAQLQAGSYRVSSQDVARKMLEHNSENEKS